MIGSDNTDSGLIFLGTNFPSAVLRIWRIE